MILNVKMKFRGDAQYLRIELWCKAFSKMDPDVCLYVSIAASSRQGIF